MTRFRPSLPRTLIVLSALIAATSLSACNALQRLSEVGEPPKMTAIENPVQQREYRPVSMPMPAPRIAEPNANSLWRPGARAFFKDQRAGEVGDILTVIVNISNERAELSNETSRTRGASESAGLPALGGFQDTIRRALPNTDSIDMDNLIGANSDSSHAGTGSIAREETVNIRLAAVVLQVLPNGNLVIAGRQEVRVNSELRELQVTGVIRPQDINSTNTIDWDKIAEARISYGGRGTISDVQQPRYGQQIFDIVFPF
ncbi:MAG: flagellar basal body L-ring protein FlgH [Rhodospirillaceae bacterium]